MQEPNKSQKNSLILKDEVWEYRFLENGDWLYKAVTKKPTFKEKPAFKVAVKVEDRFQETFEKHLAEAVKSITKYLAK